MACSIELENLDELKILTDALIGTMPEDDEIERDDPAPLDPLIDKILAQAEEGLLAPYRVELDDDEADRLADALEAFLDLAAQEGDLFGAAEVESLMKRLGRG